MRSTTAIQGISIRLWGDDFELPTHESAALAINEVQALYNKPLVELHLEWHNQKEGFKANNQSAADWITAQQQILEIAFNGNIPFNADADGYPS